MTDPKIIHALNPGAKYRVPTYKVTNEGIEDGYGVVIDFCKGNKLDENILRQEGVFTETLLQVSKEYLQVVNKDDMATLETTEAIKNIELALFWLGKRAEERKSRDVQGTYKK